MKTRLAILVALAATAGVSTAAFAAAPVIPGNPGADLAPGAAPVLFPSEQGAFKALEVATQLVESSILQNGCDAAEYAFAVQTNKNGVGSAQLDGVDLAIASVYAGYEGRIYSVSQKAPTAKYPGLLGDLAVSGVSALGSYNIGSGIQEVETNWGLASPQSDDVDTFRGTIIKDYWRLDGRWEIPTAQNDDGSYVFDSHGRPVNTVIDYGYQQIQKHGVVAAKYWQQSQTWRQNGVRAGTWWQKTRVAPEGDCTITVAIQGKTGVSNTDNINGFNEVGYISVDDGFGPVLPFKK